MLTFNRDTPFFNDHSELILQYEQTQRVLQDRQARSPAPAALIETLKTNLHAQAYSLFKKALEKDGDQYRYITVLTENIEYFDSLFGAGTKSISLSILRDRDAIKAVHRHIETCQAEVFKTIHNQSISKQSLLQCCIDINEFKAIKTNKDIELFKYDSLLHYATRIGNIDAIILLLEMGADINAYKPFYKYTDKRNTTINTTPLGVAIASDNTRAARTLLERGARLDMTEHLSINNFREITSQIHSADMQALLMEFGQKRFQQVDTSSCNTGYSFTELMLIKRNQELEKALAQLNSKFDQVIASLNPDATPPESYQGPAFFARQYQAEQPNANGGEPAVKRVKSSGDDID